MALIKLDTRISQILDPTRGAQKALDKYALLEERKKQNELYNSLAQQANTRQQWASEAKGMGQGQLVADALSSVTSKTNGLDNTNAMEALNKTFTQAGTDDKLAGLVRKLDNSESYNEAMKAITGNKELTSEQATAAEETVKQNVLGKDYDLYKKLYNTAGTNIETLNKDAGSADYSYLYKTTDANAAKNALVEQLIGKGVNPVYADKVAAEKASQYVMTAPKATDAQKGQLKAFDKQLELLGKNTVTKETGKKSGSKASYDMTKPQSILKLSKALATRGEQLGLTNSLTTVFQDEKKDLPKYEAAAAEAVPLKNGTKVYATPDDAALALDKVFNSSKTIWNSSSLEGVNQYRKALGEVVQERLKTEGLGGSKGSAHKTTKTLTPEAQEKANVIIAKKQALLNSLRNPTGQEIADKIAGTKNGKRADVVNLSSLYSKTTEDTKTQEKKNTEKKPETNALLAALNSPKKGEVARVTAVNANDLDKLRAMVKGLSDRDKKRLENVTNSSSTQDLLAKLLNTGKVRSGVVPSTNITKTGSTTASSKVSKMYGKAGSIPPTSNTNPRVRRSVNYKTAADVLEEILKNKSKPSAHSPGAPRNR